MRISTAFFIVIGLLTSGAGTPARAQSPVPLTLAEALAKAIETSHRLAEARARQEGAEAE